MRRLLFVLAIGSLLPLLIGCTLLQPTGDATTDTAVTETTTVQAPPPAQSTPAVATAAPVAAGDVLIVWLPTELAPGAAGTAVLEEQIRSFAATRSDVQVRIEYKTVTGQGGILSYLRTGHNVAPTILPDLVALPTDQLATAVADRIIYPLPTLPDEQALDALYPAARALSTVNNTLVSYPFALTNLTHLAYRTTITGTVPATWEQLRATPGLRFAFPASGPEGVNLLLQLYLQAGGQLSNEDGAPQLQVDVLARALEQFNLARADGVILRQSSTINNMNDVWQLYESTSANIILTSAQEYLRRWQDLSDTEFAPAMGLSEPLNPSVNGWVWAISTAEPNQQALAADLLSYLITAENIAAWSRSANLAPAREDALALWPDADEPYPTFLQQMLTQATPQATSSTSRTFIALANALSNVIALTETPQIAAAEAAAAVER